MKKLFTNKIFYKKYLYKLRVYNEIGTIFRSKNLSRAKKELDSMQVYAEINQRIPSPFNYGYREPRYISLETFVDATVLYTALSNNYEECLLRCEVNYVDIYSNKKNWLEELGEKIDCLEFHQPETEEQAEYLLDNADVILSDKETKWIYKAYLSSYVDPQFAEFCKQNNKHIKIGKLALEAVEKGGYVNGYYFYTTSDKFLMLANIASGAKLTSIVKYVNRQELNK